MLNYWQAFKRTVRSHGYAVDFFKPHLGGYKSGRDWSVECKSLFKYFYDNYVCKTALDVGCGEGYAIKDMVDIGYKAKGIDGFNQALLKSPNPSLIRIHDLTKRPYVENNVMNYDFIWCCEVAEHIEEKYTGNLILSLAGNCKKFLAMTHALPGEGGYHHVNCREPDYWINLITAAGLKYDDELTKECRGYVKSNVNGYRHFVEKGLIFKR